MKLKINLLLLEFVHLWGSYKAIYVLSCMTILTFGYLKVKLSSNIKNASVLWPCIMDMIIPYILLDPGLLLLLTDAKHVGSIPDRSPLMNQMNSSGGSMGGGRCECFRSDLSIFWFPFSFHLGRGTPPSLSHPRSAPPSTKSWIRHWSGRRWYEGCTRSGTPTCMVHEVWWKKHKPQQWKSTGARFYMHVHLL